MIIQLTDTRFTGAKKCGRASKTDDGLPIWYEPKCLPKPKIIELPMDSWCDCPDWKRWSKEGEKLYMKIDFDPAVRFCSFCGQKLAKTKLEDGE